MKIIFSPSKEMREENIFENKKIEFTESPFKDKTNILIDILKQKSIEEIESIMKLKADLLAKTYKDIQNYDRLKSIPAISMYYGVSFKELELEAYSEKSLKYLKDKLFILSALYGLSKPFDLLKKYRLDMTMSIVDKGLYNFWKKEINEYISKSLAKDEVLLNLASGEFSKLIDTKKINMINIDFKEASCVQKIACCLPKLRTAHKTVTNFNIYVHINITPSKTLFLIRKTILLSWHRAKRFRKKL